MSILPDARSDSGYRTGTIHLAIKEARVLEQSAESVPEYGKAVNIKTKRGVIKPRTPKQAQYIANILDHDITFGVGPAGTGKTYLAVAAAVDALERRKFAVFC